MIIRQSRFDLQNVPGGRYYRIIAKVYAFRTGSAQAIRIRIAHIFRQAVSVSNLLLTLTVYKSQKKIFNKDGVDVAMLFILKSDAKSIGFNSPRLAVGRFIELWAMNDFFVCRTFQRP
jgi:hypothetical protein